MKVLIVEDDFVSRKLLQRLLGHYGECDIAVNGNEAIEAIRMSIESETPYDLICMDIMMPGMDGQQALIKIREMEKDAGIPEPEQVKVIMTTALDDPKNVVDSLYRGGAVSYIVKPIERAKLIDEVRKAGLLE